MPPVSGSYLKTTDEVDFVTLAQNRKEVEPDDQESSFSRTLSLESRTTHTYFIGNSKTNTAAMAAEKTESIVAPGENGINAKAELGHVHSLQVSAISDALDEQEEKKLLKKIDLWLMPLLTVAYMLQFLDKVSLSYASIMGIIQDLNLIGNDYTWSSSVFYFGFLAFSYPASFLMVRLPLGKYLAVTCISWSIVLACHAAASNFAGLIAVRFFLGAAEASISPGFSLITGMWYKREEQPFRHGVWFFGNSVSAMFGGLLAYGIAHITVGIEAWRWLFIILGIITFVWGVVLLFFLPDQPGSARFLSQDERVKAVDRIRRNQTGVKDSHFRWAQVREAFVDPQVWLLIIFQLAFCISNGGFITFSNIVLAGFGFKILDVYLLNIPIGVAHAIFSLGATFLCGRLPGSRTLVAAALSIVSLIGSILVRFGPNTGSKLAGLYLMIAFVAGFPISLSMISSNVAGFTKKSVASAMMFVAYCAGNIAGPFLFFPSEAPVYQSGFIATTICFGASALAMFALRAYLIYENRRRDQLQPGNQPPIEPTAEQAHSSALSDPTDKENQSFRYVY